MKSQSDHDKGRQQTPRTQTSQAPSTLQQQKVAVSQLLMQSLHAGQVLSEAAKRKMLKCEHQRLAADAKGADFLGSQAAILKQQICAAVSQPLIYS